jgi:hypothetical protein
MPVLKNVKVSWASVQKPNIQFEPCWEIQVHLDKDQASKLQAEAKALNPKGIKLKEEGNEFTFRFRRKVEKADGTENKPPVVCGPGGIEDKFTRLIGNGSICNVQYLLIAYDNKKFGKGVTTDLKGVQVLEHVAYGEADGEAFGSANNKPIESNSYDDGDFN